MDASVKSRPIQGSRQTSYKTGDRVRVLVGFPPGHVRVPHYIKGRVGVIVKHVGYFANPERLAYGLHGEPKLSLYRVRFRQIDLWANYSGNPRDSLDIEIYESWLAAE